MPARTRSDTRFVVTLSRNNEVVDTQIASDGDKALQIAIILLCQLGRSTATNSTSSRTRPQRCGAPAWGAVAAMLSVC